MPKICKDNMVDYMIGFHIKLGRYCKDKSVSEVAKHLNISSVQLRKYESGENRISASRLFKIAKFLNAPIEYFYQCI